jgi:hypothetical protein
MSIGMDAPTPCAFQRLRWVGKALDGELAQLVPRAGLTSAQTGAVIPAGTRLPSRSLALKVEFRRNAHPYRPYSWRFGAPDGSEDISGVAGGFMDSLVCLIDA